MQLRDRRILITGGAGLVGSALADRLVEANDVLVVDDLSNGRRESVPAEATFLEGDLTDAAVLADAVTADLDLVIHCAAADKYVDTDDPRRQFEVNVGMTHGLLERMAEGGVDRLAFTSSSTVYGEAPRPTPEDHAPLEPISVYGAAKLAEEGLLSVYAHTRGFEVWNLRFANVVGPRLGAGVIPDFVEKLRADPERLEILGDGRQEKSYTHVEDCANAVQWVIEQSPAPEGPMHTYNLGTRTTTSVDEIAAIVSDAMGLDPAFEYTGGDRGWAGDVPRMRLDIGKLLDLGWEPELESDGAVRRVAEALVAGDE